MDSLYGEVKKIESAGRRLTDTSVSVNPQDMYRTAFETARANNSLIDDVLEGRTTFTQAVNDYGDGITEREEDLFGVLGEPKYTKFGEPLWKGSLFGIPTIATVAAAIHVLGTALNYSKFKPSRREFLKGMGKTAGIGAAVGVPGGAWVQSEANDLASSKAEELDQLVTTLYQPTRIGIY
jgi:hypothetical protein